MKLYFAWTNHRDLTAHWTNITVHLLYEKGQRPIVTQINKYCFMSKLCKHFLLTALKVTQCRSSMIYLTFLLEKCPILSLAGCSFL